MPSEKSYGTPKHGLCAACVLDLARKESWARPHHLRPTSVVLLPSQDPQSQSCPPLEQWEVPWILRLLSSEARTVLREVTLVPCECCLVGGGHLKFQPFIDEGFGMFPSLFLQKKEKHAYGT